MAIILYWSIHIMCDCLELFSFCSFAILDVKIFELCDKGAIFFLKIFDEIGFQWDGDGFFYGLNPQRNNSRRRYNKIGFSSFWVHRCLRAKAHKALF